MDWTVDYPGYQPYTCRMAISNRTKFLILIAISLFVLAVFSGQNKLVSSDILWKSNFRNSSSPDIHYHTTTVSYKHEVDTLGLYISRDLNKSDINLSIFEDSAIGTNLKVILTHVYNDEGKALPHNWFPAGPKGDTTPNMTDKFEWKSTSKRIVNRTICDAIIAGKTKPMNYGKWMKPVPMVSVIF